MAQIVSKPATKEYRDNYDQVFGKKAKEKEEGGEAGADLGDVDEGADLVHLVREKVTPAYFVPGMGKLARTKRDINQMACACGGTSFKETDLKDNGNPVYECLDCGTLCVD